MQFAMTSGNRVRARKINACRHSLADEEKTFEVCRLKRAATLA